MADLLLLSNGVDHLLLTNGVDRLLLSGGTATVVYPSFRVSVQPVQPPALPVVTVQVGRPVQQTAVYPGITVRLDPVSSPPPVVTVTVGAPPGNPPSVQLFPSLPTRVLEPSKPGRPPVQMRTGRPLQAFPSVSVRVAPLAPMEPIGKSGPQVWVTTGAPRVSVFVPPALRTAVSVLPPPGVVQQVRIVPGLFPGNLVFLRPSKGRLQTWTGQVGRVVVVRSRSSRVFDEPKRQGRVLVSNWPAGRVVVRAGRVGRVVTRRFRSGSGFTSKSSTGRMNTFGGN